ncbi:hypothetical protein LMG28614_04801 [Paraburkholderia ultramafica]|uniref:Uncharacterized protein n=1 Tax=Paraburkholderia ultramafica TaxID=1544867 RepID=A0A6S7BFU1_9BURK|nr:hypothetical protein LMG28614_04801 [Paraburkholderia ultramafica]
MYFLSAVIVNLAQGTAFHRSMSSAPIMKSRCPWH